MSRPFGGGGRGGVCTDVCSEPESSGGGKVKYAKNLHRTCLDTC